MGTSSDELRSVTTVQARERRITWLAVCAWMLCFVPGVQMIAFALFAGMCAAYAYVLLELRDLPCPRCGRTFFRDGWLMRSTRRRSCIHCGLSLDSSRSTT